jgi:hypothetical protein
VPQPIHKILEINQRDEVALKIPFSHKAWVPHPFRVFCGMGGKPRIFIARALYRGTASAGGYGLQPVHKTTHLILEINQRDEVALKSRPFPKKLLC